MSPNTLLFLATLALSATAATATTQNRRCLPPMGKTPFDAEKFAGEWFVVAGVYTNMRLRAKPSCLRATYGVTRDANGPRVTLAIDAKLDGATSRRLGSSVGVPLMPGKDAVVQSVWTTSNGTTDDVSRQAVLATDYARFALFYACQPIYLAESDAFDVREVVNVWSKTPKMDAALLDVVKVVLSGYNVDVEQMLEVDNGDC